MSTKLVLLGTGTPNACPNASGPACAVVVDDRAYLVDFGPGVVRQASKAYYKGIDPLRPDLLTTAFCTHLHTDHTVGYADLIFTPWVLERSSPLKVFGPKGLQRMTDHLLQAYAVDIDFRLHGFERANEVGYQVQVQEIQEGIIYRDERVQVEAFAVSHGTLESYGYRFVTQDGVIVVSGDTAPLPVVAEKAKGCDILLHEVEYAAGIRCREEKWQKYHREVHTLSTDLAVIAAQAQPKLHKVAVTALLQRGFHVYRPVAPPIGAAVNMAAHLDGSRAFIRLLRADSLLQRRRGQQRLEHRTHIICTEGAVDQ